MQTLGLGRYKLKRTTLLRSQQSYLVYDVRHLYTLSGADQLLRSAVKAGVGHQNPAAGDRHPQQGVQGGGHLQGPTETGVQDARD